MARFTALPCATTPCVCNIAVASTPLVDLILTYSYWLLLREMGNAGTFVVNVTSRKTKVHLCPERVPMLFAFYENIAVNCLVFDDAITFGLALK